MPALVPPYADHNLRRWPAGLGMDWHSHTWVQVIHILEGTLEVDWGEGWRAHTAGQAHVLPPGFRHRLRSASGQRQFGLNCTSAADERGLIAALRAAFPVPATVTLPVEMVPAEALAAAADEHGANAQLRWQTALDGYVLALLDHARPQRDGGKAQRLLTWLRAHADRPLYVAAAARAVGLSRTALQRVAHTAFGSGVAHCHERLRLDRAARLMLAEDLDVAAAAAAAGYPDLFQFSRAFRRVKGVSPLAWKRRAQGSSG